MGVLLQLSLLVALAAVIAVDAGVLPIEEKFIPTGEPKTHFVTLYVQRRSFDVSCRAGYVSQCVRV